MLQNTANFFIAHAHATHDAPGFANSAHHAVLNAVVYHLDIMSGASLSNNAYARFAVLVFCGDLLQQRQKFLQGRLVSARTHGGTSSSGLISAADSTADISDSGIPDLALPSFRICKVFIAAVENHVIAGQVRHEAFEDRVADAAMWKRKYHESRCRKGLAERVVVCWK
jgi:hypothetical protein